MQIRPQNITENKHVKQKKTIMKKYFIFVVLLIYICSTQHIAYAQSVTIQPSTSSICAGSGTLVTLDAVSSGPGVAVDWQWSNGQTGQDYIDVSPSVTTTYSVTVTFIAPAGNATATTTITVVPQPAQATITPVGPTTVCTGNTVQLDASAGTAWQWYRNGSPISGANSQSYFATQTGNYTVLVTVGICNTPMSLATTATIMAPPTANVTPTGPITLCYGNSSTLQAQTVPGANYQWQFSPNGLAPWTNIPGANTQNYDANASGFFRVAVSVGSCVNYSN